MIKCAISIALVAAIGQAHAGFYDGNQMHESCQRARYFALGYVAGAYDSQEVGQGALFSTYLQGLAVLPTPSDKFSESYSTGATSLGSYCIPKGAILNQATDIFCQYLAGHPAERQESASVLLAKALDAAWPCKPLLPIPSKK